VRRKTISKVACLAIFFGLGVMGPTRRALAADDITVEFMASQPSWEDSSATGHAFICVGLKLRAGIKEECFGFYPRSGGKGAVYGPGCVDSELNGKCGDHPITRFSNVVASVKKTITDEQRRAIYAVGKDWSARQFVLGWNDCVAFSNAVAQAAGLTIPRLTSATPPAIYVAKLKQLNP
jgi:hypothetical protein